jgi:hypothetical protein
MVARRVAAVYQDSVGSAEQIDQILYDSMMDLFTEE